MPFDANQFVNAGQFGDSSFYSGLDGQMRSVTDAAKEALVSGSIRPPEGGSGDAATSPQTFNDFAQQRIDKAVAPITQTYNKLSNTADQLGQGNIANAYNAYKAPVTAEPTVQSTGFDYSSNPFRKYP